MLSTKEITVNPGGSISKTIEPGEKVCKILSVELEVPAFDKRAYNLKLQIETEPLGGAFEGFFIDKDNPSLGRYEGQVGRVRFSQYAFLTNTTKTGIVVDRDTSMMKALMSLCKELDCLDWWDAQDEKHATIESIFEAFNRDKPFKNKYLKMCIGAQEYFNKEGYKNFDLFLVRPEKGYIVFENTEAEPSKLMKFDAAKHILPPKGAQPIKAAKIQDELLDEDEDVW
jgi:hypothetical protein